MPCESIVVVREKGRKPREKQCGEPGIRYRITLPALDSVTTAEGVPQLRQLARSVSCFQVLCNVHKNVAISEGKEVVPA